MKQKKTPEETPEGDGPDMSYGSQGQKNTAVFVSVQGG